MDDSVGFLSSDMETQVVKNLQIILIVDHLNPAVTNVKT